MTNFGLFEITRLDLVRIDTKIIVGIIYVIKDKKDHINVFDIDVKGQISKSGKCFFRDP